MDPDADMIDLGAVSVVERLNLVMRDVQAVGKDGFNQAQKFNFRGVDAVVNAVGPALRRHGVVVLPRILSARYRDYETTKGALMHECIVEVEYTFACPGSDPLVCSAMGESADSGDKATAKAMSVAYRTMWLQALCIPTDEPDPDETTVERGQPQPVTAGAAKRRLIEASTPDIAQTVWGERGSEPIEPVALEALEDVARGMKAHAEKAAAS